MLRVWVKFMQDARREMGNPPVANRSVSADSWVVKLIGVLVVESIGRLNCNHIPSAFVVMFRAMSTRGAIIEWHSLGSATPSRCLGTWKGRTFFRIRNWWSPF